MGTGVRIVWMVAGMLVAFPGAFAGTKILPTDGRNIWRVTLAELDGNPQAKEIIGGAYDGRVCAFSADGRHLWDAATGGFVFDVAAGDLDKDGRDELAAACADGWLYVWDHAGRLRWKYDCGAIVNQAAILRFADGMPVVVAGGISKQLLVFSPDGRKTRTVDLGVYIREIITGVFNGNSLPEICVISKRSTQQSTIHLFEGPELSAVKLDGLDQTTSRNLGVNGVAVDMNGDGAVDLVADDGVFGLRNILQRFFEFDRARFPRASYDINYRMPLMAAGNLIDDDGMETVVVNGPDIALYNATGQVLGQVRAPQGFTDVLYVPGTPRGSVLLAASPNGDDNLYRVTFDSGWESSLEKLERRGRMAKIGGIIETISRAIAGWQGTTARGVPGPFPVQISSPFIDAPDRLAAVEQAIEEVRLYEKEYPYPNLQFAPVFWISEDFKQMRPDGQPWGRERRLRYQLSREQIVGIAEQMEQARAHFWVQVGHGNDPYLTIETADAILRAAPDMCLGFVSAEDEGPDEAPYFLKHFVCPIMESCLKRGNRMFILREKNTWWGSIAALPEVRQLLFSGRYRSVLVPSVEDSNSRTPDLNLAGRVGLWLGGEVDRWASRMVADCFSFNRANMEWEYPMTGHPHLRYLTAHTALGASVFMIKVGQKDSDGRNTRVGQEGISPFLHMLGKGIIAPPERSQLAAISPVALSIINPSERYLSSGSNGHWLSRYEATDLNPWALGRLDCYWGMAPTPSLDLATILWGRTRQFGNFIPPSPYGFVAIMPGRVPPLDGAPWSMAWQSNGDAVFRNDIALQPEEALRAITADLQAGMKKFPFVVEGEVFFQAITQPGNRYFLYLIDPGYLDPGDRSVHVVAQVAGTWSARDRISGEALGMVSAGLLVRVPEGGLRILELEQK